jgi:hypothetical protein
VAGLGLALMMSAAMAGGEVDDAGRAAWLEPAFRHTLQITDSRGRISRMWLDRDGGYRGHGNTRSSGAWRVRGEQLCFTQRRPIPVPFPFCTPLVEAEVGTRWNARSVTGDPITIEIVRGR